MLGLLSSYLLWFENINWRFLLFKGFRKCLWLRPLVVWVCFFFYREVKSFFPREGEIGILWIFYFWFDIKNKGSTFIWSMMVYCSVCWVTHGCSSPVSYWFTRGGYGFHLLVRCVTPFCFAWHCLGSERGTAPLLLSFELCFGGVLCCESWVTGSIAKSGVLLFHREVSGGRLAYSFRE